MSSADGDDPGPAVPKEASLTVVRAEKLPAGGDAVGEAEYYVDVEPAGGGAKKTTQTVGGTAPSWNETITVPGGGAVKFTVKEKDMLTADDFVGSAEFAGQSTGAHALPLRGKEGSDAGVLHITFGTENTNEQQPSQHPASAKAVEGPSDDLDRILIGVRGRALLIGINYVGQEGALQASIGAAHGLRQSLKAEGFHGMIRVLADDGSIDAMPLRKNIEEALDWLVDGVQPGDGLLLYYTGHVKREAGSVLLCPADHRDAGCISAGDTLARLSWRVPPGARLLWLMDCRGGGGIGDLPVRMLPSEDDDLAVADLTANVSDGRGEIIQISLIRGPEAPQVGPETTKPSEGTLATAFGVALQHLRGSAETPLDEAGRVFQRRVEHRFPGVLAPLLTGDGGYIGRDFAAWAEKPLTDLQAELTAFGISTTRAAPLQNIARQIFRDRPDCDTAAPPPLRILLLAIKEALDGSAGLIPVAEAARAFDADAPFLPASDEDDASLRQAEGLLLGGSPVRLSNSGGTPLLGSSLPALHGGVVSTPVAPEKGWTVHTGYISTGGEILGSPRLMTVEDALILASRYPECKGFSFRGEDPNPPAKVWVYFKDKWDIHGRGWTSYQRVTPEYRPEPQTASLPSSSVPRNAHHIDPWMRQRLVNFYQYYNPSKLPSVVPTLQEYQGFENVLFDALTQKYGPEPPDTMSAPLPPGWRLVESPRGDLFYKHADGRKQWERPVVESAFLTPTRSTPTCEYLPPLCSL
eukprot:Sspe_Gene.42135::Locus_20445_Transcript_1_1_Confidence_1.000_Length_2474::g.42135::m.42135